MATAHLKNPRVASKSTPFGADREAILGAAGFAAARAEIAGWPGYAPTPLVELPGIAKALGLGRLWYKDESHRFDLASFKALGGAYAVFRHLKRGVERRTGITSVTSADLLSGRHAAITRELTVISATDGNHGRSVAWGAQLFHCRCVIVIHAHVSEGRRAAIARFGAEVVRIAGTYDDSVRHAAEEAARRGWTVISDTSYEGYTEIPRDVMAGYGVMADEAMAQLPPGVIPTHALAHVGVGGWAAALLSRHWQAWGERRPRFIAVEPDKADGLFESALAGRPTPSTGSLDTIMAGLSCAEISPLVWPILSAGIDDFLTIEDDWAAQAMRLLADRTHGDPAIVGGETGVASLAALLAIEPQPAIMAALGLGPDSTVLVYGSEGATDPEIYQEITGRTPEAVLAA